MSIEELIQQFVENAYKSALTGEQIDEALSKILSGYIENLVNQAIQSAKDASDSKAVAIARATSADNSATLAESWAVGGTNSRVGENTNNAKYWAESARHFARDDIFIATYGETPFADIEEAIDAGKVVFAVKEESSPSNRYYIYMLTNFVRQTNSIAEFTSVYVNGNRWFTDMYGWKTANAKFKRIMCWEKDDSWNEADVSLQEGYKYYYKTIAVDDWDVDTLTAEIFDGTIDEVENSLFFVSPNSYAYYNDWVECGIRCEQVNRKLILHCNEIPQRSITASVIMFPRS